MDIKKNPQEAIVSDDHDHDHVLTISGAKKQYFALLKELENEDIRVKFQADPQPLLRKHGIDFPEITSDVVTDNLPNPEHLRAFREAFEEEAAGFVAENVMRSHAHLVWDLIVGQSALTRKHKKAH